MSDIPASLTGGGDCQEHYHQSDRDPSHFTLRRLQELEVVKKVSTAYTVLQSDDIILVDTTAVGVTVTLPLAVAGSHITVLRVAGANNVTIACTGANTINGAATVVINTSFVPQTFKAMPSSIGSGYYRIY